MLGHDFSPWQDSFSLPKKHRPVTNPSLIKTFTQPKTKTLSSSHQPSWTLFTYLLFWELSTMVMLKGFALFMGSLAWFLISSSRKDSWRRDEDLVLSVWLDGITCKACLKIMVISGLESIRSIHNWRDLREVTIYGPKMKSSDKPIEFKKKGSSFFSS